MKKTVIVAATVAAVGFSAYLGFRPDPASTLTELQLANAEAPSNDEHSESYKTVSEFLPMNLVGLTTVKK
ncbi:MAG: hypothetical protein HDS57_04615 [Barnesiella sp.]|nr:hypothetical protein [Barnesiella sp.]